MRAWLHAFLACQECSGELSIAESVETDGDALITGTLACGECELFWPVLGGVPVMLVDPGAYISSYRESLLTSLVEFEYASPAALRIVDEFCSGTKTSPHVMGTTGPPKRAADPRRHLAPVPIPYKFFTR